MSDGIQLGWLFIFLAFLNSKNNFWWEKRWDLNVMTKTVFLVLCRLIYKPIMFSFGSWISGVPHFKDLCTQREKGFQDLTFGLSWWGRLFFFLSGAEFRSVRKWLQKISYWCEIVKQDRHLPLLLQPPSTGSREGSCASRCHSKCVLNKMICL